MVWRGLHPGLPLTTRKNRLDSLWQPAEKWLSNKMAGDRLERGEESGGGGRPRRRVVLLPEEVASQVAAGEVIERPASIVKELVENSLDAGARRIEVRTDRGGISLVRVVDDGCGMSRDDALTALERHATSKIRTGADLANVSTLGFRGEALPSIASVSRFTMRTREPGAVVGTQVSIAGGRIESVSDCGEAPGTQIEVKALFFNLPARRKFLRSEQTENGHIEHQLQTLALCYWRVAFIYTRDGREVFRLPAADSLATRVADLFGRELLRDLLIIDQEVPGFRVSGLVGRPGAMRSTRASQFLFVNGRAVEARELLFGIREGYGGALPRGRHPVLFLSIGMPPGDVDVNVHPAKREVRFRRPLDVQRLLAEAIQSAIHHAVSADSQASAGKERQPGGTALPRVPAPNAGLGSEAGATSPRKHIGQVPAKPPASWPEAGADKLAVPEAATAALPVSGHVVAGQPDSGISAPSASAMQAGWEAEAESEADGAKVDFLFRGPLGERYLLFEDASGLVVMDISLARQRIYYERIQRQMREESLHGQQLLMPPVIEFPPREADWLRQRLDVLAQAGVVLEPFGLHAFKLDCLPSFLDASDPETALMGIIEDLREGNLPARNSQAGQHDLARALARRAAADEPAPGDDEARRLVASLLECDLPYCCPEGNPTMIHLSFSELAGKFGR